MFCLSRKHYYVIFCLLILCFSFISYKSFAQPEVSNSCDISVFYDFFIKPQWVAGEQVYSFSIAESEDSFDPNEFTASFTAPFQESQIFTLEDRALDQESQWIHSCLSYRVTLDGEDQTLNKNLNVGGGQDLVVELFWDTEYSGCENDSCTKGCTHPMMINYNPVATQDDGTCSFEGVVRNVLDVDDLLYLLKSYAEKK